LPSLLFDSHLFWQWQTGRISAIWGLKVIQSWHPTSEKCHELNVWKHLTSFKTDSYSVWKLEVSLFVSNAFCSRSSNPTVCVVRLGWLQRECNNGSQSDVRRVLEEHSLQLDSGQDILLFKTWSSMEDFRFHSPFNLDEINDQTWAFFL